MHVLQPSQFHVWTSYLIVRRCRGYVLYRRHLQLQTVYIPPILLRHCKDLAVKDWTL